MSKTGHATEVWKDYDVLRCVHCDAVIQVPHEAFKFKCPHCEGMNEFEEVVDESDSTH